MHADDNDWLQLVCRDSNTQLSQYPDGPELPGGYLHAGQLPEPRAVRRPSTAIRQGIHKPGEAEARRTVLRARQQEGGTHIPEEGEGEPRGA